jgi:hypothetical protein
MGDPRHGLEIDLAWVERRDALLRAQEDAAIKAARDDAATDEERAFVDAVLKERARNAELSRKMK